MQDVIEHLARQYIYGDSTRHSTPRGLQLQGKCPFHGGGREKNPSFFWNLDNGMFFCHSCKASGSFPTFLKMVGITGSAKDDYLSRAQYDATISSLLNSSFKRNRRRNPLLLNSPLPEATIGLFDLTPNRLVESGFKTDLLQEYEIGYDQFNQRIIYPIRDLYGRLIGFSGRADAGQKPRYKIYSSTELKNISPTYSLEKGNTLWNIHNVWDRYLAPNALTPNIIVVEGFKAALHVIQAGYPDVVALMGSYLSEVQRFILSLLGGTVYLFLDNNEAGQRGTKKAFRELRQNSSCHPVVVRYPKGSEGKQPDDLTVEQIHQMMKEV
jgi:DNA primase